MLTAEDFSAHTGTSTLTYSYSSGFIGQAQYGPDQTLLWAFQGEPCVTGHWTHTGDQLCFSFANQVEVSCWLFSFKDGKLLGVLQNSDTVVVITETARSDQPLVCPAPEVGV
ncbi:MAG: hypothetical protein MUE52_07550 [Tabrizicola sp.]|nr:hypothetical protein [Tabrizicola sp.]